MPPLVIMFAVVIVVAAGILAISRRQLRSTWEGTVVQVTEQLDEDEQRGVHRRKVIAYREPGGRLGTLAVDADQFERMYAGLAVGDRLIKHPGERWPVASKP
jgi:hypothetical protein